MEINSQNNNVELEETMHRPGKEPQGTNPLEGRNVGRELENRQLHRRLVNSNRRNAELEREAAMARVAQGGAPPTKIDPAIRHLQGRPRGSSARKNVDAPVEENNQENPTNPLKQ
uniref:Uncharacterized protein n=1 Tax=Cannabis sativa TaxID=3483 RepID=A0A803QKV0_CANSA